MGNSTISNTKIISFTDLETWKQAHNLVKFIYETTDNFSKTDMFGITSQMQRSALSISSNIAEGFGRQSSKDKLRFYVIARGSLTELQNQLIVCKDTNKISYEKYIKLEEQSILTHKLLHGLIKSTDRKNHA